MTRWCISCGYWRARYGALCETCHEDAEYALTAQAERDTDDQGDARNA